MNERKEKLEAIFQATVELGSPEQQEVYLNRACAGEPELRREVEELLRAAIAAEAVFEGRGTVRIAEGASAMSPVFEQVGSLIGRYKLLERVGEGRLRGGLCGRTDGAGAPPGRSQGDQAGDGYQTGRSPGSRRSARRWP